MVITDAHLEAFIGSLTGASEALAQEGAPPFAMVNPEMIHITLSVAEELLNFRTDFPDIFYSKVIADEYGERGEQ